MAVAGRVPHRGEALVPHDRRVPDSRIRRRGRSSDGARPRRATAAACSIATSPAGTTTASSATTSRPIRGAIRRRGAFQRRSPSWGSRARPATARAPSTRAPTPTRSAGSADLAPRADPTIVNPARLPPARAADICGRCHGQRIADDVGPFLAHGDPFVPGRRSGAYSRAAVARHAAARRRDRVRAALLGRRHAAADRLRVPGLAAVARARAGAALTCTSCHGMHEGNPRGQIRSPFAGAGRRDNCTGCHAPLAAPAAAAAHAHHDPAGRGRPLRRLPHAAHGVRRARHAPQHRIEIPDPARAARRGPPRRVHLVPRRSVARVGDRARAPLVAAPGRRSNAYGCGRCRRANRARRRPEQRRLAVARAVRG